MALTPGTRLGPYDIVALIGVGGMGEVYKGRDPRLDRDVAIKVLPAELASRVEMVQRFQREARAVAAINHPSIVTIHSVEEADGVQFLTMELVEGRSLDRLIPAGGLDVERILAIADALAGALAAAHDKRIVHRDLKPANIMLTDGGAVKVLDFGLAKLHGPPPDQASDADLPTVMHTSIGVVMGTLPYMWDAAARALQELLALYPDFPEHARQEIEKFFYAQPAHAQHVLEGLRKAGLEIPGNPPVIETAVTSAGGSGPMTTDEGA